MEAQKLGHVHGIMYIDRNSDEDGIDMAVRCL